MMILNIDTVFDKNKKQGASQERHYEETVDICNVEPANACDDATNEQDFGSGAMNVLIESCIEDMHKYLGVVIGEYLALTDSRETKVQLLREIKEKTDSYDGWSGDSANPINIIANAKLEELEDGFVFCEGCETYIPVDDFDKVSRMETKREQTYTDAGYGDDDCFGDVTRYNTYHVCPRCGDEALVDSMYMGTKNEKTRLQLRSKR